MDAISCRISPLKVSGPTWRHSVAGSRLKCRRSGHGLRASVRSPCLPRCRSDERTEAELLAGRTSYRPDSFEEIVDDASGSILRAVEKGETRLEVEFPPLPASVDGYKGSSDDFIDANAQLAVAAAKNLLRAGKRVRLLFPDATECSRSRKMFDYVIQAEEGLSFGYTGKGVVNSMLALLGNQAGTDSGTEGVDLFLILNHSTIELPGMRRYVEDVIQERPAVLWNLELETLRGDLGLLGFPAKDLHYDFLSQFKSVFFLRLRDYSKSISTSPFLFNYSGALFREYPGPWQVLLKEDKQYICVAEDRVRYTLFDFKEELMASVGLDTEEEGSALGFLRRGYKQSTWWEENLDEEKSKNWRT